VYVKGKEGVNLHLPIICLYVDGLLVNGSCAQEVDGFNARMRLEFEITDLGKLAYFLGFKVLSTSHGVVFHQDK
jgi:hypothetical protein